MDLAKLQEPFAPDGIEWRLQRAGKTHSGDLWGKCTPYLTSRAIMQRLDDACGPENWRNEFTPGPMGGVLCGISIFVEGRGWVTKWDGAENTDVEAVKGGLSGAMKRAAVQWGIGRYLYDLPEGWARIHRDGQFRGATKDKEQFRWDPPELPAWALPKGADGVASDAQIDRIQEMMQSHHVADTERAGIQRRLGAGMDVKQASACIEWLSATIREREQGQKGGKAA